MKESHYWIYEDELAMNTLNNNNNNNNTDENRNNDKKNQEEDNDSSDEYEEVLIFLGFPHYDNKLLFKENTKIEIIGAETDNPICKVYGGI